MSGHLGETTSHPAVWEPVNVDGNSDEEIEKASKGHVVEDVKTAKPEKLEKEDKIVEPKTKRKKSRRSFFDTPSSYNPFQGKQGTQKTLNKPLKRKESNNEQLNDGKNKKIPRLISTAEKLNANEKGENNVENSSQSQKDRKEKVARGKVANKEANSRPKEPMSWHFDTEDYKEAVKKFQNLFPKQL